MESGKAQAGEVRVLRVPTGGSELQEVGLFHREGVAKYCGSLLQAGREIRADFSKKPYDLAAINKQEAKVFIHDAIRHLRTEGNIGSTITGYVKALKSGSHGMKLR